MIAQSALSDRSDFQAIAAWVKPDSSVLDLGCGDGILLRFLKRTRNVRGYGIDIADANVLACVKNGVNVIQSDLERGLAGFDAGDVAEARAILVPDRETAEQVADAAQAHPLQVGRPARSDASERPQRGLERHCTMTAWPGRTEISRMPAGRAKGASRSTPAGFSAVRE